MYRPFAWPLAAITTVCASTSSAQIKLPDGFAVETVYEVPRGQGSWVSLANLNRGRLIACDQGGALYRVTLGDDGPKVEKLETEVGRAQGLLYAFDSLYVMGRAGKRSGLFRLRDTSGDDQFDQVDHLIQMRVGGEHHGHAIVLSPDGTSLYVCAGNMTKLPKPDFTRARMPRVFAGDHVLQRMPDANGHNNGALPIGGWVMRVAPDGSDGELIANGFRNHYDMAFNAAGDLFTYDSDMEWDIGTAWYRPTRICHVVSGAEFGWRFGSGKWPDYYVDSVGSVVDIGAGSPTGVTFGTGAKFPARYQHALFAADWSYGVIYAIHLAPSGASYTATKEVFATAAPFPVTDLVVRPEDGALYFTTGGRGAASALYRVTYNGAESTAEARSHGNDSPTAQLRRKLEALHTSDAANAIETAWPHLADEHRHVRFAARLAIEHRPVAEWRERALAESRPHALVQGAIALSRLDAKECRDALIERLCALDFATCTPELKLALLRAFGLVRSRLGTDGPWDRVAERLAATFPDPDRDVNKELCRLLCALDEPSVASKAVAIMLRAPSQEEQMHYAYCLRDVTAGWTEDLRRSYFEWFQRAAGYRGGSSFRGFCNNIRKQAIESVPPETREALGALLTDKLKPRAVEAVAKSRPFVKLWTIDELVPILEQKKSGHDFARGREMFGVAACIRCHRFAGEGGSVGPDLTKVGGRFGTREILESIIEPSKVISDQYEATIFELDDGKVIVGYVANYSRGKVKVAQDMLRPGDFTPIDVKRIKSQSPSPVSTMPAGLLVTLSAAEIQDLVAYMRSGGDPAHELFK